MRQCLETRSKYASQNTIVVETSEGEDGRAIGILQASMVGLRAASLCIALHIPAATFDIGPCHDNEV